MGRLLGYKLNVAAQDAKGQHWHELADVGPFTTQGGAMRALSALRFDVGEEEHLEIRILPMYATRSCASELTPDIPGLLRE